MSEYPFLFNDSETLSMENRTWSNQLDEACMLFGANLKYIDVTHAVQDNIFGEALSKTLERGIPIRLIVENIEADFFPEESGIFSKFGYTPQLDVATFFGSTRFFDEHNIVPQENDLIYYEKTKKMFEIVGVTLLDDYKYRVDTRLYNYNHDDIADDVTDISILNLEDINDDEVVKIIEPITDQNESDDFIDEGSGDGLYD